MERLFSVCQPDFSRPRSVRRVFRCAAATLLCGSMIRAWLLRMNVSKMATSAAAVTPRRQSRKIVTTRNAITLKTPRQIQPRTWGFSGILGGSRLPGPVARTAAAARLLAVVAGVRGWAPGAAPAGPGGVPDGLAGRAGRAGTSARRGDRSIT
jgi:hypothetical protein